MKKIKLSQDKFALIDDEDFDFLSKWSWCVHKVGRRFYAVRNSKPDKDGKRRLISMHGEVLKTSDTELDIDHINGDGLDNRKSNLRLATRSQNMANRGKNKGGSSKFCGVTWNKKNRRWVAQIKKDYKAIYIGSFDSEVEAARAYDKKALELFGEFAVLNFKQKNI